MEEIQSPTIPPPIFSGSARDRVFALSDVTGDICLIEGSTDVLD
ncbi:hypothetical protein A2U01_0105182, partial [Trifolium medium]|nr:hypothetical protein [Trifolium medium]